MQEESFQPSSLTKRTSLTRTRMNGNHNCNDNGNDNEAGLSLNTVKVILNEIHAEAEKRVEDGLNRYYFTFGVANTHLVVYMWAVYPQHFWILYLIEAGFFLSFRLYKLCHKKPLNQALHYLDFCWITNIACYIFFCIVLFVGGPGTELFSDLFRQEFFLLAFGISCGPLFGALLITPLPLVFHKQEDMASLFIHFFPPLQMYILRWNSNVMKEVWPTFHYDDFGFLQYWPNRSFLGSVFGNSLVYYFAWAVPYMIWQLVIGLDLPTDHNHRIRGYRTIFGRFRRRNNINRPPKYDTVYHFNMRDGQCIWMGKLFWNRPESESRIMMENNDYELRDFFAYMLLHFIGVLISILLLAWFCSLHKYVHAGWILVIFIITIVRGANRYVYYCTKMYESLIEKYLLQLEATHKGSPRGSKDDEEKNQAISDDLMEDHKDPEQAEQATDSKKEYLASSSMPLMKGSFDDEENNIHHGYSSVGITPDSTGGYQHNNNNDSMKEN